jgi:hypothetical protein
MSKIHRPVLFVAAILCCWSTAAATATATATPAKRRPSTRPAARADVDRSSPRAGLKAFLAAVEAQDRNTALACFHSSNKPEQMLARSVSVLGTAQWQLRKVARHRLGEAAAQEICGDTVRAADVDKARVEEDGDTAVVFTAGTSGFKMVKVEGRWLISAAAMAGQEKHGALLLATGYVDLAARHAVASKGILEGRYRSVEQIRRYLRDGTPIEEAASAQ